MDKKIYNLMNWPDIEGIVYSECSNPHTLLGPHLCKSGMLIQVFRPDAVEINVSVEGKIKKYPMEKVDEAGYFAVCIPGRKKVPYKLIVENLKGKKEEYIDPYAFESQLTSEFINKFKTGGCYDIFKSLGAHQKVIDGIKGIQFMVWAPNAVRVSVVGEFNNWDGRILQMEKNEESGIFELFVPGLKDDIQYKYEIKSHGDRIAVKTDPYALHYNRDNGYSATVQESLSFNWEDTAWYKYKKERKSQLTNHLAICELHLDDYKNVKLATENAEHICEMGFDYVELMPPCEFVSNSTSGYETIGYFAPTERIGSTKDFMTIVNEFHKKNIGVIIDLNLAFMSKDLVGPSMFDGSNLYEKADAHLEKHPELDVATFDYSKPQVRQMLISSVIMWAKEYHIDGFRIDETASMLYLDYGRKPGEWVPNIYGDSTNLEAVEFLHTLRNVLNKKCKDTLLIAEESSAWPKVTGDINEDGLGFDYKWNYGWKENFISFIEKDPLFRKGEYGKLTYSMLYNYSENYLLTLSHEEFNNVTGSIADKMPGMTKEDKIANIRLSYAYMYMHPGKKLLNLKQCFEVEGFVKSLNEFYIKNSSLYEMDYDNEGFEWVDNSLADETVLTFIRRNSDGKELFVVANFTPVVRENYITGVAKAGKYTEVFNSDAVQFMGHGNINQNVCCSEKREHNGNENSICITLPPLAVTVFEYEPYTEIELEEIQIKHEAAMAKKKAEEEARIAEDLKVKAEEEAKQALEAQKKAEAAAEAALKAKISAEKKAVAAKKASEEIDTKMKKKLAALEKKK